MKTSCELLRVAALSMIAIIYSMEIAQARLNPRIEDGLAITHPRILETLSQRASGEGLGLGYFMDDTKQFPPSISNLNLSRLPLMRPILDSLREEIKLYQTTGKPGDTVGVGMEFHNRLFDLRFLDFDRARFSLIGVINRMDKAFLNPKTCGETRFIYRLSYNVEINGDKAKTVISRLPMTINLILNAKAPESKITCQEIAKRWQTLNIEGLTVSAAADAIMGPGGPLAPELRHRDLLKQLELNLQLSRKAAGNEPDFGGRAVYLLKLFRWNAQQKIFQDSPLDNQIERSKAAEFYAWLFQPEFKSERLGQLDRGTLRIPDRFLSMRAYSVAPGALSRAINHSLFRTLSDEEINKQLREVDLTKMLNIKSAEGFKRRLSDMSCAGCHQTRGIGGFHFIGQDPYRWKADGTMVPLYPGNAVVVPGSGHFFADLERRRALQKSLVAGELPNYAMGFSSRPQEHIADRNSEGRGAFNGWGAHCYVGSDPSFARWTCSSGNRCIQLHRSVAAPGMGVCISNSGLELGEPTETGSLELKGKDWFSDKYTRIQSLPTPKGAHYSMAPQSAAPGQKTGGFPGGSIQMRSCAPAFMSAHPEAGCGALPAGNGFNDCLFDKNMTFPQCVKTFSVPTGMRRCSRENPCRDDYICAESLVKGLEDEGVCVPPYFTFQFRVDGHPVKFGN